MKEKDYINTSEKTMNFPNIDFSLWLAFTSILLLVAAELTSPSTGQTDLILDRKRLKNTGITLGILFLISIAIKIYAIIINL